MRRPACHIRGAAPAARARAHARARPVEPGPHEHVKTFMMLVHGALWLVLSAASPVDAQGRISNATIETRTLTAGSFEREVQAVANRGGAAWIGYRTPMIPGRRQMCCYNSIAAGNDCCGMCRLDRKSVV